MKTDEKTVISVHTIYKDCNCGRNYMPHHAQTSQPPHEWAAIKNILDEYGLQAIDFVADWRSLLPRQWIDLTEKDLNFWTEELSQGELAIPELNKRVLREVAAHIKENNT